MNDLRYALRQLVKAPGFTVVAVLSLALGVGANTAIFSFVEGVVLRPLPYADSDRLVSVRERTPEGYPAEGTSTLTYPDWENQQEVFEGMAARAPVSVTFSGLDETTIFRGSKVTKDYFRIFGIGAALGRTFVSAECNPGSDKVAILSHSVWNSQFGADPNVIGRAITLDGEPRVVIGVLQEAAAFDKRFSDIWCPLAVAPENRTRNYHWLWAAAKLKEGVTIEHARTQMSSIGARLSHDFPDTNRDWDVTVATLETEFVGSNRSTVSLKLPVGWGVMCGQLRGKRTSLRVRYAEYLLDWCKTPAYLPDRLRRTNSTMHA